MDQHSDSEVHRRDVRFPRFAAGDYDRRCLPDGCWPGDYRLVIHGLAGDGSVGEEPDCHPQRSGIRCGCASDGSENPLLGDQAYLAASLGGHPRGHDGGCCRDDFGGEYVELSRDRGSAPRTELGANDCGGELEQKLLSADASLALFDSLVDDFRVEFCG